MPSLYARNKLYFKSTISTIPSWFNFSTMTNEYKESVITTKTGGFYVLIILRIRNKYLYKWKYILSTNQILNRPFKDNFSHNST